MSTPPPAPRKSPWPWILGIGCGLPIISIVGCGILGSAMVAMNPEFKKTQEKLMAEQKQAEEQNQKRSKEQQKKERDEQAKRDKEEQAKKDAVLLARNVQYNQLKASVAKFGLTLRPFDDKAPELITVVSPGPVDNYTARKAAKQIFDMCGDPEKIVYIEDDTGKAYAHATKTGVFDN